MINAAFELFWAQFAHDAELIGLHGALFAAFAAGYAKGMEAGQ